MAKKYRKISARPLALSSWQSVRHRTPSQPRNPLEHRKSTVRLLPSGPDLVPMAKIRSLPSGKPLQSPAIPRDRISQLKCGLDSPLGAPPPAVAPPKAIEGHRVRLAPQPSPAPPLFWATIWRFAFQKCAVSHVLNHEKASLSKSPVPG